MTVSRVVSPPSEDSGPSGCCAACTRVDPAELGILVPLGNPTDLPEVVHRVNSLVGMAVGGLGFGLYTAAAIVPVQRVR